MLTFIYLMMHLIRIVPVRLSGGIVSVLLSYNKYIVFFTRLLHLPDSVHLPELIACLANEKVWGFRWRANVDLIARHFNGFPPDICTNVVEQICVCNIYIRRKLEHRTQCWTRTRKAWSVRSRVLWIWLVGEFIKVFQILTFGVARLFGSILSLIACCGVFIRLFERLREVIVLLQWWSFIELSTRFHVRRHWYAGISSSCWVSLRCLQLPLRDFCYVLRWGVVTREAYVQQISKWNLSLNNEMRVRKSRGISGFVELELYMHLGKRLQAESEKVGREEWYFRCFFGKTTVQHLWYD